MIKINGWWVNQVGRRSNPHGLKARIKRILVALYYANDDDVY